MRKSQMIAALAAAAACAAALATPLYNIIDIGVVSTNDSASQAMRVSGNGIATGRSFGNPTRAFTWTQGGGLVGLPNLTSPTRNYSVGNGVNNDGIVVGTGSTTSYGSNPLPLIWQNGAVSQLPLPSGYSFGRANDINSAKTAIGSVGSGSGEVGVIYSESSASVITTLTDTGCFVRTPFGINDAGRIVGFGIDPADAARNVGYVLDTSTGKAFEVPPLAGNNGAIAFDVCNAGYVVGVSSTGQSSGMPFFWSGTGASVAIPLPTGTSLGQGRGVNSSGWAVGNAGGVYSVPWLWDGTQTYRLQDIIVEAGWDLSMNTSASAMGISEDGIIVGTAVHNGATHAYAMIPVPEPATLIGLLLAGAALLRRR
jgi:uncharacterized membrane protein